MNTAVMVQERQRGALLFRLVLIAAGVSLAFYIPYKYTTQLHAITGMYAFLFPLSGMLAMAGIVLGIRPQTGCDCSVMMRAGFGGLAVLWLGTGLLCVPSLMEMTLQSPGGGLFAVFHMLTQHVVLSLSVLAFAFAPALMANKLGVDAADSATAAQARVPG